MFSSSSLSEISPSSSVSAVFLEVSVTLVVEVVTVTSVVGFNERSSLFRLILAG